MHTGEHPIDLSAARRARAPATAGGDRWAHLHGVAGRPARTPAGPGSVVPFRPAGVPRAGGSDPRDP